MICMSTWVKRGFRTCILVMDKAGQLQGGIQFVLCLCGCVSGGGGIHMSSHYLYPVRTACTSKQFQSRQVYSQFCNVVRNSEIKILRGYLFLSPGRLHDIDKRYIIESYTSIHGVGGVTVSMVAFQAVDPGSTPGRRITFC